MLLASFIGCLLVFLLIGFSSVFVAKPQSDDYLLAGRSVPPSLAGLSAVATNNSGYMFIGVIGYTYMAGLSAIWLMVGWILGDLLASFVVHKRLCRAAQQQQALTFPEIISRWWGQDYALLGRVSALLLLVFLSIYAAAQLNAGGKAMSVLFDWDVTAGAWLGAVMVLFYCFSGGLRASIWTDAAQSVVMFVAMLVMCVMAVEQAGGLTRAWDGLHQISSTHMNWFPADLAFPGVFGMGLFVLGWLFGGIGVIGQPHIMVRFMAMGQPRYMNRARLYYYLWFFGFYFLANGVGLLARLLIPPTGFDAELALPMLAKDLLHPALAGMVLAGLFAATISTADSLILSCSAALHRDLLSTRFHGVGWARVSTLLVIIFAMLVALYGPKGVFDLVIVAWAVMAAGFGPLLVVYALGGRPPQPLAIAMLVTGVLVIFIWRYFGLSSSLYEILPAMLAGIVVFGIGHLIQLTNQSDGQSTHE